jgi:CheY-like chemotaxis protein
MPKKVLVVDDSRTALLMATSILAQHTNYSIRTASDGEEAVQVARAELPDLILMDVVMPRLNGFEACKQLRHHDDTARIPIIMLTTRGEQECVEQGYLCGCNDYLTKPVNGNELVSMLEAYLGE